MAISPYPSSFVLPVIDKPYPSLIDFICSKFPQIDKDIWIKRVEVGKLHYANGDKLSLNSLYNPHDRIFYYREVEEEPIIPFEEKILFENKEFLIVDKPHFLPVIPAGNWIEETLINRLRKKLGNEDLIPINRIDRETAGLVIISKRAETRDIYQSLFRDNLVNKEYEAICSLVGRYDGKESWHIRNRLVKGDPWFRMKIEDGEINAESYIELIENNDEYFKFRLLPKTGKKHQLRIHLALCGFQIINDRYYPKLLEQKPVDYSKQLQLLAKKLSFIDPISKKEMFFESKLALGSDK